MLVHAHRRPLIQHARAVPLWRKLQQLADAVEPKMQRAVIKAAASTVAASNRAAIAAEVKAGNIDAAIDLVPWNTIGEDVIKSDILRPFGKALERAGEFTFATLPTLKAADFSITNPAVDQWVQQHGADLVVQLNDQQRLALRGALETSLTDGLAPQAAADHLMEFVGLHQKWSDAVSAYRSDLMAKGDPQAVDLADNYALRLRRARAQMIGRTEAQFAVQNGRSQGWDQAVDAGVLDRGRDHEQWLTAEDELADNCPICGPMDGQTVPLGEQFVTGEGDRVDNPPDTHPACRCDVLLIRDGVTI